MTVALRREDALLPENATRAEVSASLVGTRFNALDLDLIRAGSITAICPPEHLPYLAWDRSVDVWRSGWTVAQKRAVTAGSLRHHKRQGTPAGVEDGLLQRGFAAQVTEWFEYGGDPYYFRVALAAQTRPLTLDDYAVIKSVILTAKNVRSMLDTVTVESAMEDRTPRVVAYGLRQANTVTIEPWSA